MRGRGQGDAAQLLADALQMREENRRGRAVRRPRPGLDRRRHVDPKINEKYGVDRGHQGLQLSDAEPSSAASSRRKRRSTARCHGRAAAAVAAGGPTRPRPRRAPRHSGDLGATASRAARVRRRQPAPRRARPTAIAIIGMAGQFPQGEKRRRVLGRTSRGPQLHRQRYPTTALGPQGLLPARRAACRARPTASGWAPWTTTTCSIRCSSTSRRPRRRAWTRSSACSCRPAGTASRTPDTTRSAVGQQVRRVRRLRAGRLSPGFARAAAQRAGLHGRRHVDPGGAHLLLPESAGSLPLHRHRLLVVAGRDGPGLRQPGAGRQRHGAGRRRVRDGRARDAHHDLAGRHAVAGRPVLHLRPARQRLRARREASAWWC